MVEGTLDPLIRTTSDWWLEEWPLITTTTVIEDDEPQLLSPILGPDGVPLGRPPVKQGFIGFICLKTRETDGRQTET